MTATTAPTEVRVIDDETGTVLHAATLTHHKGRLGTAHYLRGKSESWTIRCTCGMAGEYLNTRRVAEGLYALHVRRMVTWARHDRMPVTVEGGAA